MNRRDFVFQSGKAAFSLSGLAFLRTLNIPAAVGSTFWKVPVFGHLWVYAAKQPGYDPTPVLDQVFSDMAYAGLAGVELMHQVLRHADAVERIGDLKEKYKIDVLGTSYEASMWDKSKHQEILEDAGQVISRVAKLGGRTFGTSVGAAPAPKTPEQLDAQADMVKKLMSLCRDHNVVLNLHNHTYEVTNGQHDLKGTLARIPEVKLGPDLNWLVRAGINPVDFIREYGNRIVFLHIRDQYRNGRWSEAVGEGDTDFAAIGKALREINFNGDAVIELAHERDFTPTRPLRDSWKMSRDLVRKSMGF